MNYLELFKSFVYKDEFITLPYRLFIPKIEEDKRYPLVVFLHGANERGDDNEKQVNEYKGVVTWASTEIQLKNPCFIFAPQCPEKSWWGNYSKTENVFKPNSTLYTVMLIINRILDEYPIDEKRVYITGLSMGGFGTITLISEFPEKFAAGVVVCGGGNVKKANKLKKVPIWFFHAEDDPVVPVEFSRVLFNEIKRLGGDVRYTEYPRGYLNSLGLHPHSAWIPAYKDKVMIEWLFKNIKK
ncbi:MAG: hypothetical protein PWP02_928 [Thermosipho sp. (in: thermotogales)]|nr:hypothetical protein [Petrotoga sp.]MDN5325213.1 hypothetical protein [Thermosipho sp. (in: thermotogales)]